MAFIFIAYLFALFAIIGDLFRDHKLNGLSKAIWIIFLIFVPFLTALIYLIARGKGMAERGAAQAEELQGGAGSVHQVGRRLEPGRGDRQGEGAPGRGRDHPGGVRSRSRRRRSAEHRVLTGASRRDRGGAFRVRRRQSPLYG